MLYMSCTSNEPESHHEVISESSPQSILVQLTKDIEANPREAVLYLQRGRLYSDNEDYELAIEDYDKCRQLDTNQVNCWRGLADAYLSNNQPRRAVETLEDLLTLQPDQDSTRLDLVKLQIILERYAAAHRHLNLLLEKDRTNPAALFLKGLIYKYEDKPILAAEYVQQAVQSDPDMPHAYMMLGLLFEDAGNPLALKYYENALRLDPNNPEYKLAIANYMWSKDEQGVALHLYDTLIVDHSDFVQAYFNRGLLYMELKDYEKATLDMDHVLQLEPNNMDAYKYLSQSLLEQGRYQEALGFLHMAANISPNHPEIQKLLTEAEIRLSRQE